MGKQIFRTTVGLLLAVMFLVSLSGPAFAACDTCNACNSCSACPTCNSCDKYTWTYDPCTGTWSCKEKGPTWEDWFNAFKNDGFWTWAGINNIGTNWWTGLFGL